MSVGTAEPQVTARAMRDVRLQRSSASMRLKHKVCICCGILGLICALFGTLTDGIVVFRHLRVTAPASSFSGNPYIVVRVDSDFHEYGLPSVCVYLTDRTPLPLTLNYYSRGIRPGAQLRYEDITVTFGDGRQRRVEDLAARPIALEQSVEQGVVYGHLQCEGVIDARAPFAVEARGHVLEDGVVIQRFDLRVECSAEDVTSVHWGFELRLG